METELINVAFEKPTYGLIANSDKIADSEIHRIQQI